MNKFNWHNHLTPTTNYKNTMKLKNPIPRTISTFFIHLAASIACLSLFACAAHNPSAETPLYTASDYISEPVFTHGIEGPAIDADGFLYAVNFASEGTIGIVSGKEQASLFLKLPEGSTGNGIRFDKHNTMYIADYTGHNILKVDTKTKKVSTHAHSADMNQPNDIAISSNGTLYASDPNWKEQSGQLWKIDPNGTITLLEKNMGTTNGIEVSPDEKHLYVNESIQRKVWIYDIGLNGDVNNKRLFIEFPDYGLDGMRCDSEGNLHIARYGAGLIAMVSSDGKLIREIKLKGQHPTNLAFGGIDGKTIFVTLQKRGAIETFKVDNPGRSWLMTNKN